MAGRISSLARSCPAKAIAGMLAIVTIVLLAGCGGDEGVQAAATVTVTESADGGTSAPPPGADTSKAVVRVAKSGFGYEGGFGSVGYGLVLKNDSSQDATNVSVSVNVLDANGLILTTDTTNLTGIPAHGTFNLGGDAFVEGGGRPARLETQITNESAEAAGTSLPKVSNVRITDSGYGLVEAAGQVENPYTQPLSQFALIGIVAFGANGKVISGSFTYLDAPLPPGRSAAFNSSLTGVTSGSQVSRVAASMENSVGP